MTIDKLAELAGQTVIGNGDQMIPLFRKNSINTSML